LLPATDDVLRTRLLLPDGELSFQEFFVRDRANRPVTGVDLSGLEAAQPGPGVLSAIEEADLIVIAESSPVASIRPILELPGVRQALGSARAIRVALSPMVMAKPPASAVDQHHWQARELLMGAVGLDHRPEAVARLYLGLVDVFVLDRRDGGYGPAVGSLGLEVREAELLDRGPGSRNELANLLWRLAARADPPILVSATPLP
jgi:LPPG:FO 2-phospho-L-lactate transferase